MKRLGIAGAGQAGRYHARAIAASRRAAVAWVADPARDRGEALAAECGARAIPDVRAGLGDVDAVIVCTPHTLLAATALEVIEAGVPLLLEKPMAATLDDADRVRAAARGRGVVLAVGFVHRFRPEAARAHRLIADGAIGAPQFLVDDGFGGGQSAWPAWVQRAGDGGGLLLYSGVHRFDRARWLLGGEVRTVAGSVAALLPGSNADSSYAAVLTMTDGARAALAYHYHAVPVPHGWQTVVHGSEGLVRIRTGEGVDLVTRKDVHREAAGPDRRFEAQLDAFLDALDGAPAAVPTGADGRAALAVALAVARAHATGRTITLAGD